MRRTCGFSLAIADIGQLHEPRKLTIILDESTRVDRNVFLRVFAMDLLNPLSWLETWFSFLNEIVSLVLGFWAALLP